MNNAQVAKVVHAAIGALDETHGGAQAQRWEELNDQARTDKQNEISGNISGQRKQVDVDAEIKNLPERDRLPAYIRAGIVDAFSRYEQSVAGGNSLASTSSEEEQLHQTTSVDAVNAQNARQREINSAMENADAQAAQQNAEQQPPEHQQ